MLHVMHLRKLIIFFAIFIVLAIIFYYKPFISYYAKDVQYIEQNLNQLYNNNVKFTDLINAFDVHCDKNISLVVLVLCSVKDITLRNTIRHTWGQWTSAHYSHFSPPTTSTIQYHSQTIKLFFVLGSETTESSNIKTEIKYLRPESRYNDIMFFPGLKDSYMNLTMKTLSSLNEAVKICSRATYFVKADTDVFLNIPLLTNFCNTHSVDAERRSMIFGNMQVRAPVIRDKASKWYVPNEKYRGEYFPNYVTGCGYILTKLALQNVIKEASTAGELFAWEDVAVTGIYSKDTSIIDTKLFRYENFGDAIDSCYMKTIILAHRISAQKMTSLWNDIVSNKTVCSTEIFGMFDRLIASFVNG